METIQINQILQDLNNQVYNKILSNEEKETFREQTTNRIKQVLDISINPLDIYNFFNDLLSNYLFNPDRQFEGSELLQKIEDSDSQELKNIKTKMNEQLTNFIEIADSPGLTRTNAIKLRENTIVKILEINGILESTFKLYTYADSEMWRILNVYNYYFQPTYAFIILSDDPQRSIKEYMNLDLEILQKGLLEYADDPINRLNIICLIYIYDKLLDKFKNENNDLIEQLKIFLQKTIWKEELPADFNNLYALVHLFNTSEDQDRSSEFSLITDYLELFTSEHFQFMNELGIDYYNIVRLGLVPNPLFEEEQEPEPELEESISPVSQTTILPTTSYEEDQESDYELEVRSVSSSNSAPYRDQLCPESFISLDKYEPKEYNQMLSFYLTKDDLQSYYRLPSCLTKRELLDMIISDVERYVANPRDFPNNIPNTIMCICTPPESPKEENDFLTGLSSKPTPKIFVKIPYQFNDSMSFYVTLGSFLRAVTLPPQEWFALPLFGGQRRRLGNLAGFYGQSMNHGQIPGFRLYKLYTRSEINNLELTVSENLTDYPLIFYQNFRNISFETQQKELSLIEMVYYTIDFFLKFDSRSFTFSE